MRRREGVMCGLFCSLKLFMYATISNMALYELIPPKFKLSASVINLRKWHGVHLHSD